MKIFLLACGAIGLMLISFGSGGIYANRLIKQSCDNMEENITMIGGSPYVCLTEQQAQALVKQGYMMGLQAKGKEI